MKTIEINLYKFDELSNEVKQKAIELNYDINLNYDWYTWTYDDSFSVKLKIHEFNLESKKIKGEFIYYAIDTAKLILENHGHANETYMLSEEFIDNWEALVSKYSDGINKNIVDSSNNEIFDIEAQELESNFLNNILNCYLTILNDEYNYLGSEESIINTLINNDYDFTEDGTIY